MLDIQYNATLHHYSHSPRDQAKLQLIKQMSSVPFFVQDNNEDGPSVNTPHSSSRLSKQAPPTSYYKDKYRHLLGSDSGKDAAKATKSNSAYGYGKCLVKWVTVI